MVNFKKTREASDLDVAITRVLDRMKTKEPGTEEYSDLLVHLERLEALKVGNPTSRFSPDTILLVAGNLAGILIIVGYEQKHVVTTRAKDFIQKLK